MDREELVKNLEYTEKKHRDDKVYAFGTDISMMCADIMKVLGICIEIPEGSTFGDVFMAMFPESMKKGLITVDLGIEKDYAMIFLGSHAIHVPYDLWNSPYKGVGGDK